MARTMKRRTFLQSAAAAVSMGILVDFAKAEFAPEYPWEKTIFNPYNRSTALFEDFRENVGKYGKHYRGILLCRYYLVQHHVWPNLVGHCLENYPGMKIDAKRGTFTWPTGERLTVRTMRHGMIDYWTYHGHAYQWIGFESITDWPTKECYNRMRSVLRWPHADDIPWKPPEGLLRMRSTYYS